MNSAVGRRLRAARIAFVLLAQLSSASAETGSAPGDAVKGSTSGATTAAERGRITDQVIPLQDESIPERPAPILELGDKLLAPGAINHGFQIPTGAVWQPSLIVWGDLRTAVQSFDDGVNKNSEWANRFDLYSNLYLTQSERIVAGIRPLDKSNRFTRYTFDSTEVPEEEGEFEDELNSNITTLFFEGDFGELFPLLDRKDQYGLDVGLAVGRQPINYQEGMLVNDTIDSLGVSKINLKPYGAVNQRVTLLWGWDELNRNNLPDEDSTATLFGVFNEIDFAVSTIEADVVYVESEETGDGLHGGLGAIQRVGQFNTTLRVLGSIANGTETGANNNGTLLFGELSRTLTGSNDIVYVDSFWAIDSFRSASRASNAGGPVSPVGILFEAVGLGRYRAPLANDTNDAFGGALGYQLFSADSRWQAIFELGGRYATEEIGQRGYAGGTRLQTAIGRRTVIRVDLFGGMADQRTSADSASDMEPTFGTRLEWLLRL